MKAKKCETIKGFILDYKCYIFWIILMLIIRIWPGTTNNSDLDGMINEISVGVFASTLVTCIVAYRQDKIQKTKRYRLRKTLYYDIEKEIIFYMEMYPFSFTGEDEKDYQKRTFSNWSDLYIDKLKSKKIPWIDEEDILKKMVQIRNKIEGIISNKIMLLENDILSPDDIEYFKRLKNCFDSKKFIKYQGENYPYESLKSFNKKLEEELSSNEELEWLVNTDYMFEINNLSSELESKYINIYNELYNTKKSEN